MGILQPTGKFPDWSVLLQIRAIFHWNIDFLNACKFRPKIAKPYKFKNFFVRVFQFKFFRKPACCRIPKKRNVFMSIVRVEFFGKIEVSQGFTVDFGRCYKCSAPPFPVKDSAPHKIENRGPNRAPAYFIFGYKLLFGRNLCFRRPLSIKNFF